jgi:hypothetical protein
MDHNMVLWLRIIRQKRRQWQTNAPQLLAVLMATAVRRSSTDGIPRCGMSRTTPEATGCRHRVTTCSVLPQRRPGQQHMKRGQKHGPTLLDISMAPAVPLYDTTHIARWKRTRALVEATRRCHWASIAAISCNWSRIRRFFSSFFIVKL